MKTKGELKAEIADNKIDDVLSEIIKQTNNTTDGLHNDIIVLKNRWTRYKENCLRGLGNESEGTTIVHNILGFIDIMPTQSEGEPGYNLKPFFTSGNEYFRMYGLRGLRDSNLIQDFNVSRAGGTNNINPIQFLWADALYGNTISAKNIGERNSLRIHFNHYGGWGCNIAIRCQDGKACHNTNRSKYLTFDARIPSEEIKRIKRRDRLKLLNKIGISIRIVNGKLQHWEYAYNPKEYITRNVEATEWDKELVKVNLSDENNWHQFKSDGNIINEPDGPDFSIIASVILGFGSVPKCTNEPEPGSGIIDIRKIELSDN